MINNILLNQFTNLHMKQGVPYDDAKHKALDMVIDLNLSHKDIKNRLEEIAQQNGGKLPYLEEIFNNYQNSIR